MGDGCVARRDRSLLLARSPSLFLVRAGGQSCAALLFAAAAAADARGACVHDDVLPTFKVEVGFFGGRMRKFYEGKY